jgi:uncharacterized membrane protein (DUF106 family)
MFIVGVIIFVTYYWLGTYFDAIPVARLPFQPMMISQMVTHRNLPGEDYGQCSMTFLFVLCSMSVRNQVQRAFGFTPASSNYLTPPPGANLFGIPLNPDEQ